jgi:hypothetical protein
MHIRNEDRKEHFLHVSVYLPKGRCIFDIYNPVVVPDNKTLVLGAALNIYFHV